MSKVVCSEFTYTEQHSFVYRSHATQFKSQLVDNDPEVFHPLPQSQQVNAFTSATDTSFQIPSNSKLMDIFMMKGFWALNMQIIIKSTVYCGILLIFTAWLCQDLKGVLNLAQCQWRAGGISRQRQPGRMQLKVYVYFKQSEMLQWSCRPEISVNFFRHFLWTYYQTCASL